MKRQEIQALLDRLDPPAWIDEMRRYYSQHGTLRPDHTARLVKKSSNSTILILQKMAQKS